MYFELFVYVLLNIIALSHCWVNMIFSNAIMRYRQPTADNLSVCLSVIFSLHFCICLYICVLYAFDIDNLFSLWAASIDKHIASLAARHCAFFS